MRKIRSRSGRTTVAALAAASAVAFGVFGGAPPARAEVPCPQYSHLPAIDHWETTYEQKAVTLCQAYDATGNVLVHVQIVDFEAGGKMRVMSEPWEPAYNGTRFASRTADQWFPWVQRNVGTPAPGTLFSVTNGSFHSRTPPNVAPQATMMQFPEKKWNGLTSLGDDDTCYTYEGASAKRYFGLSDPRSTGRQFAYIDTFDEPCETDERVVNEELSSYRGQPVRLFDATVGLHPLYGDPDFRYRRTFVGTLSTDRLWHGTQDRAYLLTSEIGLTAPEARDILAQDFGTMYNLQLAGGYDTQYEAITGGLPSSDPAGPREIPEVLVIYNAP